MAKEKKKRESTISSPEKSTGKKAKKRKTMESNEVESGSGGQTEPATTVADGVPPQQIVLSPIAKPLADEKLKKRCLKLVKKAAKLKQLRRGVKEVVKALRKKNRGLCIIAGDISPIDVIAHLPIMCEDRNIPYVYVHSKEELGAAGQTKRPSSCMLIVREADKKTGSEGIEEFQQTYDDVYRRVEAVQYVP